LGWEQVCHPAAMVGDFRNESTINMPERKQPQAGEMETTDQALDALIP